jgi:predicted DNA-binding transcriptional regulator AlpA
MNTSQAGERESAARACLLNEHNVAELLNISVASVRRWRLFGRGPRYLKIGASVRYRPEDVSAWIESRPTGGTSNTDHDREPTT